MKKVTLILSFFILACAGVSFGQTSAAKQVKTTPAKPPVKAIAAAPATGSNEAKPKPKPKPKPSSGGKDYLLELDGVKAESKDL